MKKIKNVLMILPLSILALNVQANSNIEKILNNKNFVFEELNENSKLKGDLYQKDGKLFYTHKEILCEIKKPNKNNKIFEKENQILSLALKEEFDKIQEKKKTLNEDNIIDETNNFVKIYNKINKNIFCNSIPYTEKQIKEQKNMIFAILKIRDEIFNDYLEKNKIVIDKDPIKKEIIETRKRGALLGISSNSKFKNKLEKYHWVLLQNLNK
ncbi:hypothetical protein JFL47_12830 [Haemophilus haemoglobinophilus]|nr:hypothetical protein [Canicola haemoglobinophilus]MBN6712089.1 hypothetical protein [Canicola haemoglobinophilus]